MLDKSELLHDLELGTQQTLRLIEGLTPAEWEFPSQAEGWRVCDVAAHLLEVDEKIILALHPNEETSSGQKLDEPPPSTDWVTRYQTLGERIHTIALAQSAKDLDAEVVVRDLGQLPAGVALHLRLFEQFHHTNDILFGLKRSLLHLPELVAPAFRFVRLAAPLLVSRERIAGVHLRYGFRFGEERLGDWRLVLANGDAKVEAWQGEPADVVVSGDPACFLLEFTLGKGDLKQALLSRRLRIQGDHKACARLCYCFPLVYR